MLAILVVNHVFIWVSVFILLLFEMLAWSVPPIGQSLNTSSRLKRTSYQPSPVVPSQSSVVRLGGTVVVFKPGEQSAKQNETDDTNQDRSKRGLAHKRFSEVAPVLSLRELVQGLLISASLTVIYGPSNCGKTFLAADLALHVASGKRWFNREVEQGPVAYFALEGGSGINNRIVAWRQHHGFDDQELPFALIKESLSLIEGGASNIIETCEVLKDDFGASISLIVIDTVARAMSGGDENTSRDMGLLVSAADRIREKTGASVVLIHHTGKDTGQGARGHSSLRAASDTELEVTAEGADRRVEVRKQRDLAGGQSIPFCLDSLEIGTNVRGEPVTSCVVRSTATAERTGDPARHLKGNNKRAYEVLRDTLATEGQSGSLGVPDRLLSIPEQIWRDRFYTNAMPGDDQPTKQKAFRRAVKDLFDKKLAAMNGGRVWLTARIQPGQENQT